jgi:gluconolactonase
MFLAAGAGAAAMSAVPRALAQWQPSERYPDPSIKIIDPSFADTGSPNESRADRIGHALVRRAGLVRRRPLPAVERHPEQRIMKWDEETGAVSVFRKPSNNANGNTRDRQGRLLTCEHDTRRVTRTEYDGSITVIADRFDGKPLNSPNDIVCKSDGSIWFTDPPSASSELRRPRRQARAADQRLSRGRPERQDRHRHRGSRPAERPVFSPDESKLYIVVASATPREIHSFDVVDKGTRLAGGAR